MASASCGVLTGERLRCVLAGGGGVGRQPVNISRNEQQRNAVSFLIFIKMLHSNLNWIVAQLFLFNTYMTHGIYFMLNHDIICRAVRCFFRGDTLFNFGDHLKNLRKSRGITQTQLGEAIGASKRSIQNYESNTRRPSFEILRSLSDYLDVSVDYLVGHTTNPTRLNTDVSQKS